jgi:hypothetical protein
VGCIPPGRNEHLRAIAVEGGDARVVEADGDLGERALSTGHWACSLHSAVSSSFMQLQAVDPYAGTRRRQEAPRRRLSRQLSSVLVADSVLLLYGEL